jgi:hypothetical protein
MKGLKRKAATAAHTPPPPSAQTIDISASPPHKNQRKDLDNTILDYESLVDVDDLRDDSKSCLSSWTKEEVVRIIEPFFDKPPAIWAMDSKRIELLERRLYPKIPKNDTNSKKCKYFFEHSLVEYNQHYRYPLAGCLRRDEPCVHLNEIYPLIQPLLECSSSAQWEGLKISSEHGEEVSALERVITFLQGRTAIDGRGVAGEAGLFHFGKIML